MRTDQTLFLLGIEPGIPRILPWKELLTTGVQATWLAYDNILPKENQKLILLEIKQSKHYKYMEGYISTIFFFFYIIYVG